MNTLAGDAPSPSAATTTRKLGLRKKRTEDSRMAVVEARCGGFTLLGVTIDADGQNWFVRIIARGGLPVIPSGWSDVVGTVIDVPATWAFARHIRNLMDIS